MGDAPSAKRKRRWLRRLGMATAGIVVGLIVAEVMFRVRDDGGFPRLNVYRADRELGVRLEPGASQRLTYPDNPRTTVRINREGYRGRDFPAPGADDVLIVGDSQVFGLGVEERQTFAARLEERLGGGRHVLNGGVPTYGPAEYAAVARELIAKHQPKTLVFTINLVNDLFEVARPNTERHVVRDGWAVRKDAAGSSVDFPGRTWLARKSHLFYALRSLWHRGDTEHRASEGTWRDLVAIGDQHVDQQGKAQAAQRERTASRHEAQTALAAQHRAVDQAIVKLLGGNLTEEELELLEAADLVPGALVERSDPNAEESRAVVLTAGQIARGAALRVKLRERLARQLETRPNRNQDVRDALGAIPKLTAQLDELGIAQLTQALESPLAPVLREMKAHCDAAGVRLVVLILPIDVAVSADEWKKYKAEPIDLTPMSVFADELRDLGADLGVSVLDATSWLRAAEPGAFLDHDIHMTPKGHDAVAEALAMKLAEAPPAPRVTGPPLPLPAQWQAAREIMVAGSSAASCETKVVREWLRVLCTPPSFGADVPTAITVAGARPGAATTMVMPRSAALTVRMQPGDTITADLEWNTVHRRLEASWPAGADGPRAAFTAVDKHAPTVADRRYQNEYSPEFDDAHLRAICDCWGNVYGDAARGGSSDPSDDVTCPGIYGDPDAGCAKTYAAACPAMVACVLRDPSTPPRAAAP